MVRRLAASIVIWLIGVACLVPTLYLWRRSADDIDRIEQIRLQQVAAGAEAVLVDQMVRMVDLMRAVEGQLQASMFVEPQEYALFLRTLRLPDSYPGADSVIVVERSGAGRIVRYAASRSGSGGEGPHAYSRIDDRPELAPLVGALDIALASERPAASALLSADDADPPVRTEMYVVHPIPGSERWIAVRVDVQALLDSITERVPDVVLVVRDVTAASATSPSVTSGRPGFDRGDAPTVTLEVDQLGRRWSVEVTPTTDLLTASERRQPWEALLAGLVASAAIIAFALHQARARRRAVALADRASLSESMHRRLLDAAPVGIVEFDASGAVRTWNAAAAELFGVPAAEVLGRPLVLALADGPLTLAAPAAVDELDGKQLVVTTPRGERQLVAFATNAADAAAAANHRLLILVDETDQQRLEAQLVQAQKLEMFGRLAGGIAHDFNNFLTAVSGYIDIVLMRDRVEPTDRAALLESRKAADRAAAVVAQLLTISRRQVTMPEVVDVARLVEALGSLLRTVVGDHAELRIHLLAPADWATVRIDRTHLEQIILNLVVNAGEAMTDAGHIDVWVEQRDEDVVLRVTDDGPGMDASVAAQVFEPFFTTKAGHGGTGLGLSTVFSIVTGADGTISLTSAPGAGASFEVVFPRTVADAVAPPSAATEDSPTTSGETVLVVEDDPSVRRLTTAVLQQHGYRVISAGDAEEATSLFLEHRRDIDLLLSDVVLRGRSGPQLAADLLRQSPTLPVLFVSGYAEGVLSEHGRLPEGTRFLGKPFRTDDLIHEVREALVGRQPR